MQANLETYKKDLERLVYKGKLFHMAMKYECSPEAEKKAFRKQADEVFKKLPNFGEE